MTKYPISSLAVALAAFAMACADPASPTMRTLATDAPSSAVITPPRAYPFPIADGSIQLCKTSNVGGDFDFDASGGGPVVPFIALDTDPDITIPAGGGTVCTIIYQSAAHNSDGTETVLITETANAVPLTSIDITQYLALNPVYSDLNDATNVGTRTATVKINHDEARRVVFTNTFTPVSTGCTYTKGWYRNNGSSTVIAVDGRTIAQAQAIFNATPGKPGNVTFGGNNTLLNLYQQFLAALNNLGGDANEDLGPAAVDAAIDAVQAGTGGAGLNITTTLTQTEMSDLIDTLSDFNEGTLTGWPHCDDN